MSTQRKPSARPPRLRLQRMGPRDPRESGRTASMLELFFDLVFVVAVSIASSQLHHALADGHVLDGLLSYGAVFFAIWWAWMNFTWFATSFDTDDWLYRVLTIVQMGGVLVLAAGVAPAFVEHDFTVLILSYVVMRIAMVAQWLRASRAGGESGAAARRYAIGIAAAQALWLLWLLLPVSFPDWTILVLILAEVAVPVVAERGGTTPWHPHHITERYGLFTLILLGESLLASANAIIEAIDGGESPSSLIAVSALTLIVTAALWWIYFWPPHHRSIGGRGGLGSSLRYGYTHYLVFAAAGAFSAGIEVEIDAITGATELGAVAAAYTISIPVAVFLLATWIVAIRPNADRLVNVVVPVGAVLILLDPLIITPVALTTVILVAMVVVLVIRQPRSSGREGPRPEA